MGNKRIFLSTHRRGVHGHEQAKVAAHWGFMLCGGMLNLAAMWNSHVTVSSSFPFEHHLPSWNWPYPTAVAPTYEVLLSPHSSDPSPAAVYLLNPVQKKQEHWLAGSQNPWMRMSMRSFLFCGTKNTIHCSQLLVDRCGKQTDLWSDPTGPSTSRPGDSIN